MTTAIALSACLFSLAAIGCTDSTGDLANPDPTEPDPTEPEPVEVVMVDAQTRMLPSSTSDAVALPFDLCSDTPIADNVYVELLERSYTGTTQVLAGTLATYDPRAQTKAVREIEDTRITGFTIPADGSSHVVLQLAPGSASDRAVETATADWVASNECANRAETFRATLKDETDPASGGIQVAIGDVTGVVHPKTDTKDKWIEIESFQFSATGSDGAKFTDLTSGEYVLAFEIGRPGTATHLEIKLEDLIISSITQGADGTTTALTKAGSGVMTLSSSN